VEDRAGHSLVKALRAVPTFSSLDDETLLEIVGISSNLFWRAGSRVFDRGDAPDALYLVLSGAVRVFDPADSGTDVAVLAPGEYFGELALLRETPRTLSASAVEDSELLVVPKDCVARLPAEVAAAIRERADELTALTASPSAPPPSPRDAA
jgi:CRP-like cAMP-binding protein